MTKKLVKRIGLGALIALGAVLLTVIAYLLYVILSYSRLPDDLPLEVDAGGADEAAKVGQEYVIVTQNLGFGAYTQDFTFFMDGGTESRAQSRESVISCIEQGISTVKELSPDFIIFQEIDLDSTRSHHVDQYALLRESFEGFSGVCAVNYDSAYLMYPILEPHGASKSSMVTLSSLAIDSATRHSFPISTSFSKFLDLDRCFSVSRVAVENGRELVIFNVHASAYGGSDEIRNAQMSMLTDQMRAEYEKGNYVVCGGDFNHDFTGNSSQVLNGESVEFGWAQPFPDHLLPDGFTKCTSYKDGKTLPTCRNCDVPYEEGNFTIIVDGFIVSDNVECVEVENVYTAFEYSDHCPVSLRFKLCEG
ncbi:MAG: endonuclease/exonuclease/phosphatase family protein [Clostridia bacterium]|nr:endonuclease/exonuclease/phosphatase family protein [Clostridia bacterium]